MTRWAPPLIALLLACSPPSEVEREAEQAAPAEPSVQPAAPKPARPSAPKKSKGSLQAGGSYYQYVDESGRVRLAASLDDVPERQRSTATHISVASPKRAQPRREETQREDQTTRADVVLYTTRSCPWCKRAVAYLDKIGQEYVNKDVERDPEARDEYLKLTNGNGGVPVIVVGNQWIQGWNQSEVDRMLTDSR